MKKLWVYVLCLLLIGTVALTVFAAANDTKITVTTDKTTVYRGDTVQVTVTMTGTDKFTSMGYLHDNSGKYFTVGKYSTGDALEEEGYPSVCMFSKQDGLLAAGYTDYDTEQDIAVTVNGQILTMNITIAEDAPFESFRITNVVSVRNGREYIAVALDEPELTVLCKHQYGQWTEAGEGHKQVCEFCGDEITGTHNWDKGSFAVQPDCKNDGVMEYTCVDCSAVKQEVFPATGEHVYGLGTWVDEEQHYKECGCGDTVYESHGWDEGTVTIQPDCKNPGELAYFCMGCRCAIFEEIPVTEDHDFTAWASLDENRHGRTCQVCQKQELAAHSFTEGTCTDCGLVLEYTVTFLDEDGTELSGATYHYGDKVIAPAAPEKAADNTYTYTFAGWDKEVTDCAGDAIYTATYTATYIEYTVIFADEDGTELSKATYHYGDELVIPAAPEKATDNTYTYTFAGWDKEIVDCAGDATYCATYTATYIEYTVTFLEEDGKVLAVDVYHYGDLIAVPEDREKEADAFGFYTFAGWGEEIFTCQGNATYTAQFIYTHYPPDFDKTGEVTDADAIYLLRHTLFPDSYDVHLDGDVNCDGKVTDADAVYLLRHTLFPENYPLYEETKE